MAEAYRRINLDQAVEITPPEPVEPEAPPEEFELPRFYHSPVDESHDVVATWEATPPSPVEESAHEEPDVPTITVSRLHLGGLKRAIKGIGKRGVGKPPKTEADRQRSIAIHKSAAETIADSADARAYRWIQTKPVDIRRTIMQLGEDVDPASVTPEDWTALWDNMSAYDRRTITLAFQDHERSVYVADRPATRGERKKVNRLVRLDDKRKGREGRNHERNEAYGEKGEHGEHHTPYPKVSPSRFSGGDRRSRRRNERLYQDDTERIARMEKKLQEAVRGEDRLSKKAARTDVQSRIVDTVKPPSPRAAWRGVRTAPEAFREGREGTTENTGRIQRRINNVVRSRGARKGKRQARQAAEAAAASEAATDTDET